MSSPSMSPCREPLFLARRVSNEFIYGQQPRDLSMNQDFLDMNSVSIEFTAEELEQIDDIAFAHHRENRDAAIRDLLDQWLKTRDK